VYCAEVGGRDKGSLSNACFVNLVVVEVEVKVEVEVEGGGGGGHCLLLVCLLHETDEDIYIPLWKSYCRG
jgi:hypothetical protein